MRGVADDGRGGRARMRPGLVPRSENVVRKHSNRKDVPAIEGRPGISGGESTLYKTLVQSLQNCAVYLLDPKGTVESWNTGAERLKGYTAEAIIGENFAKFYTLEDQNRGLPQKLLRIAEYEGRFEGEGWRVRADNSQFWARVVIEKITGSDGNLLGFTKLTHDLTEKKRQADELRAASEKLEIALSHMSQGLALYDRDERLVLRNDRYCLVLGLGCDDLAPGLAFKDVVREVLTNDGISPSEDLVDARLGILRASRQQDGSSGTKRASSDLIFNGRCVSVSHGLLADGGFVVTLDDVTQQRENAARIERLATHDALTGLTNRPAFRECLARAIGELRGKTESALLYFDLDRFKPINDTFGHEAGDVVLQIVADRIRSCIRGYDTAARLGGDEFAVLLTRIGTTGDVMSVALRIVEEISEAMLVRGVSVSVGASVGVALMAELLGDADELLRHADLALYRAKDLGRGKVVCYEAGMEIESDNRRQLEVGLRAALTNNEFALVYQPIVETRSRHLRGLEALIRWDHPVRGRVPPLEFVPFAEETGLMREIGDWVLRAACSEAARWPEQVSVSVNLSPTQFRLPDLPERLKGILAESGLAPHRLELEVTETAMIDDVERAADILRSLRALGIQVALDDFGTGFSSLSFLRTLPFTRIKIDRSFVRDLGCKPEAVAIVRAVTGLCSSLGVTATAEGVETEEQVAVLQAEGCGEMQGFLIGRPLEVVALADVIASFRAERLDQERAATSNDGALSVAEGELAAA